MPELDAQTSMQPLDADAFIFDVGGVFLIPHPSRSPRRLHRTASSSTCR